MDSGDHGWILDSLKQIISKALGRDISDYDIDLDLIKDLSIDSLEVYDIKAAILQSFEIDIQINVSGATFPNGASTIRELSEYISEQVGL